MSLDVPTLMLAGSFVALLSGAMLVLAWYHYREMSPVLWWAASDFVSALGIASLALGAVRSNEPLLAIGFAALVLAAALLWTSARLFNGLKPRFAAALLAPVIMLSINALPSSLPVMEIRGGASTLLNAVFLLGAAWTLTMRAREPLISRWPLGGFIVLHSCVLLTGPFAAARAGGAAIPSVFSLFGMIHFEALIFFIGATIFVVAFMRESSELKNLHEARTDALTGLANRRAFLEMSERVAERCRRKSESVAVAVFDLDHFKRVNDTFGHALGDEVLRVFARVVRETLRPGDIISRVGGEEFFAVLPGADLKDGCATANRVRQAFAEAGAFVDGCGVQATVSAGVMASVDASVPLATLLEKADAALYRAKLNGRNCVQCGLGEPEEKRTYPQLVHVA
jgi:diguanylate cyclase (GGDEF)-like protein